MTISDIAKRVVHELDHYEISYEVINIDPEFADTAAFCQKYGYPVDTSGNTIVVASKKDPVQYSACLVRASDRLDVNKAVRKLMDVRRLSFATPEQTMELTGMEIGGVTPFVLPDDLPIYVDKKVLKLEYVILGSGDRSSKLKIDPCGLTQIPNVRVVPDISLNYS